MYGASTTTISKLQRVQNNLEVQYIVGRTLDIYSSRCTGYTDPRTYHLQGRSTDIQISCIFNTVISVRPATSRDIFAIVAVCRVSTIYKLNGLIRFLCRSSSSMELTTCPTGSAVPCRYIGLKKHFEVAIVH